MDNPLVSVIVPCYNGEITVSRCMDSVLNQTYRNIEFIIVNDGSTDKTDDIILSYKPLFNKQKMRFIYIKKENEGVSEAINDALKLCTGEYICWFDDDDFLYPESIETKLNFLLSNPEFAIVTSNFDEYSSSDLTTKIMKKRPDLGLLNKPNLFLECLLSKSIICNCCHMVRSNALFEVIPDKTIYPSRYGQNWQILLPIYFNYKQAYIDKPLCAYINYSDSLSHETLSKEETLKRFNEHRKIIVKTLKRLKMNSIMRRYYIWMFDKFYYYKNVFFVSCDCKDVKLTLLFYFMLMMHFGINIQMTKYMLISVFRGLK